ncbi:MAG: hypothetical protein HYT80_08695 [Euryarchaeota archaeon]|nr:hypothetical protein [Euryarchaeota archaeon]
MTLTVGPEGAPWSSYINQGRVAAATMWGAPSLWDDADPNGRFKNP